MVKSTPIAAVCALGSAAAFQTCGLTRAGGNGHNSRSVESKNALTMRGVSAGGCGNGWTTGGFSTRRGGFTLQDLGRQMERMEQMRRRFPSTQHATPLGPLANQVLRPDVQETDTDFVVRFDLAGLDADSVQLSVTDRLLSIKGQSIEKKAERTTTDGWMYTREMRSQAVTRAFTLPDNVNTGAMKSRQLDGVLEISMPKLHARSNDQAERRKVERPRAAAAPQSSGPEQDTPARPRAGGRGTTDDYLSGLRQQQPSTPSAASATSAEAPNAERPKAEGTRASSSTADSQASGAKSGNGSSSASRGPYTWWDALEGMAKDFDTMSKNFEDVMKQNGATSSSQSSDTRAPWAKDIEQMEKALGSMFGIPSFRRMTADEQAQAMKTFRRANMFVRPSESADAYKLTVDLPEGVSKADVKLTVTQGVLDINVQGKGVRRWMLPRNSQAGNISAKFTSDGGAGAQQDAVALLEINIPKASPPKIEIQIA